MTAAAPRAALLVRNLRKAYKDVLAVDGLDLEVRAGECFGLLGPNGAGKTTTMEICEGLAAADSGEVELLGMRWDAEAGQLRQRLGVQLQDTQLAEKLTVLETVRLFRSFYHAGPTPAEVVALVQLEEKQKSRVGNLSGGQKQRLAMACALVGDPEFLFLDEPTTGLDPQARRQLWELIEAFKASGRTTLLTTHYMDEAERLCDRVAIMDHGRVIALGTPRELIASIGIEHVVEFSTANAATPLAVSALRRIEGVRDVQSENGSVQMLVTELHRAVPALLDELSRQGAPLTELRTHSASLEDVFVTLTGRICAMSEVTIPDLRSSEADRKSPNPTGWKGHPLAQLTFVRFLEFIREPEALFWVFVFPILLAAGLGVAFRNRPADVLQIAALTPQLAQALRQDKLLDVIELPAPAAEKALRTGKVALLAAPAPGGGVVYRYDDSNPEGRTARMLADRAIQRAAGRVDPVASADQIMREPGSRYIDFLIPGLLGMNLMGSAIWGMGFAIVDARRKKLMKRLVSTPMPRHFYLLSFVLSRLLLLVVEVGFLLAFGALVFGVPLRGPLLDLLLLCVLGSLSFSALGLLIASRVRTIEAASGIMNAVMMPMWILSGVFFSAQRFPELVQPVIKAIPLTAAIDALRLNMLQGAGLAQLIPQLGVLSAWLIVCFGLALKLFRWR